MRRHHTRGARWPATTGGPGIHARTADELAQRMASATLVGSSLADAFFDAQDLLDAGETSRARECLRQVAEMAEQLRNSDAAGEPPAPLVASAANNYLAELAIDEAISLGSPRSAARGGGGGRAARARTSRAPPPPPARPPPPRSRARGDSPDARPRGSAAAPFRSTPATTASDGDGDDDWRARGRAAAAVRAARHRCSDAFWLSQLGRHAAAVAPTGDAGFRRHRHRATCGRRRGRRQRRPRRRAPPPPPLAAAAVAAAARRRRPGRRLRRGGAGLRSRRSCAAPSRRARRLRRDGVRPRHRGRRPATSRVSRAARRRRRRRWRRSSRSWRRPSAATTSCGRSGGTDASAGGARGTSSTSTSRSGRSRRAAASSTRGLSSVVYLSDGDDPTVVFDERLWPMTPAIASAGPCRPGTAR